MDPSEPPEQPRVYDQAQEPDYEWLERFAHWVMWGFAVLIAVVVLMVLVGCGIFQPPPPTTTTTTTTTTTLVPPPPDHITVPRVSTTVAQSATQTVISRSVSSGSR